MIETTAIRWLIRRDMQDVLRIESSSFEFPWADEDFLCCLRQRNCIGKVAELNNKVVGFVIYEFDKTRFQILNFAVAPELRRSGIGSTMVRRLIEGLSSPRDHSFGQIAGNGIWQLSCSFAARDSGPSAFSETITTTRTKMHTSCSTTVGVRFRNATTSASSFEPRNTRSTRKGDRRMESEEQLLERAKYAITECQWIVGQCAAIWTRRFAKGRSDAAFGDMIGLSGDQVYQRRRVWETFADVKTEYPSLHWSHFYAALGWDDASMCLCWAVDQAATVAEMRAWRRAQHGEDLSVEAEEEHDEPVGYVAAQESKLATQDPPERASQPYAPFNREAVSPPAEERAAREPTRAPQVDSSAIYSRVAFTLEKCNQALSDELLAEWPEMSRALQARLINAIDNIASKLK